MCYCWPYRSISSSCAFFFTSIEWSLEYNPYAKSFVALAISYRSSSLVGGRYTERSMNLVKSRTLRRRYASPPSTDMLPHLQLTKSCRCLDSISVWQFEQYATFLASLSKYEYGIIVPRNLLRNCDNLYSGCRFLCE